MPKSDRTELLSRWGQAEEKYQLVAATVLGGSGDKIDKPTVLEITKARVKADKRMQEYFAVALR